jgi:hypothetical protein
MNLPRYRSVILALLVHAGAVFSLGAGDCPHVPICPGCAFATPPLQPPSGDIVVIYDPTKTTQERAMWVAEGALAGHDFVEPPWMFPAACSTDLPCQPKYPIVAHVDIVDAGQIPTGDPHLMRIDPGYLGDPQETQLGVWETAIHEWFHWTQNCYYDIREIDAWGRWVMEGTAVYMVDARLLEIDESPDSDFLMYTSSFGPNVLLDARTYDAGRLWMYLAEQLGLPLAEPARGVNFIRHLFASIGLLGTPDSIAALRIAIQGLGSDRSLEELFRDFAIANYTKQLVLDDLPLEVRDRYRYFDESEAGGGTIYGEMHVPSSNTDFGFDVDKPAEVKGWGAEYFSMKADTFGDCSAIGMRGVAEDDREVYWVLLGLKERGAGEGVARIASRRGSSFHHAFMNSAADPFSRLVAIAVAFDRSADVKVAFGGGQPIVEIVSPRNPPAPLPPDPVCVRPGESFGVEIRVSGPATLTAPGPGGSSSLSGLGKADFRVTLVRSTSPNDELPVAISFVHRVAAGTYALTCVAPPDIEITDQGILFDLKVCVCPLEVGLCGGDVTREIQAVRVGDFVTHQVLALDVSGSMSHENKFSAAKTMARFLINSSGASNLMGLVTFAGNGEEAPPFGTCDTDATLAPGGLMSMTSSQDRNALLNLLETGVGPPQGNTSIGDGLLTALGALLGPGDPPDKKRILLLTDGMENEAAFWESAFLPCAYGPVMASFGPGSAGNGIRIDARGLGNDAEMDLLGRITGLTGGRAEAVPTDVEAAGAGGGAGGVVTLNPAPMTLNVSNRLAEAFRSVQEDALGLDRLFHAAAGAQAVPLEVEIPVGESQGGGVQDAVFGFNWAEGAAVAVELRDGSGTLITGATPGWDVRVPPMGSVPTNVVYHHGGTLAAETYTATLSAGSTTEVLCLLSGKVAFGADTEMEVEPMLADTGFCARRFSRGHPVRIWLTAAGSEAGIAGLDLVAVIRNPDGSTNRRTLFDDGNHEDGEAGDGIYANSYPRTPFARPSFSGIPDTARPLPGIDPATYSAGVVVTGTNEYGETFTRYESATFTVIEDDLDHQCVFDADGDGLPDRWETLVGLDPGDPSDAGDDDDNDAVVNADEIHAGTHPFNPDTDRGGESDGSELANGRDPLWERDDAITAIQDYGIVQGATDVTDGLPPAPGELRLRFPASVGYVTMNVYRSTAVIPSWGGFAPLAAIGVHAVSPRGLHDDKGLSPHVKYHYYLRAEGLSGVSTAPTDIFSGTPPPPELSTPGGALFLNCGGPLVIDAAGRAWQPDAAYVYGGSPGASSTPASIDRTLLDDPDVPESALRDSREGEVTYEITVPDGPYAVTLYFSENCPACVGPSLGGTGCAGCARSFRAEVEDQGAGVRPADAALGAPADNAGKIRAATQVAFDVMVSDERLDVRLVDLGAHPSFGDPVIQAIAIRNMSAPLLLSRGDCNNDGLFNLSDAIFNLDFLFSGGSAPACPEACEVNGDHLNNLSDAIYILTFLFLGGPAPGGPFPGCGVDADPQGSLGCGATKCP